MSERLVVIKGAGDLATGVAHRLFRCGFSIIMLEIPKPTVIRRSVAFASAVYHGEYCVEDVYARLAETQEEALQIVRNGRVAVLVDPRWTCVQSLKPAAIVDAILAKRNLGTSLADAPVVIGLGPGFNAGVDVHAVVETQRGHDLGRVIFEGLAHPDTGIPGQVGGYSRERLIRSPADGSFMPAAYIGDSVKAGQIVGTVGNEPVVAAIDGILRGLLYEGIPVTAGFKVGDIDPRCERENCFSISDKARSVAGGVLEAMLYLLDRGDNIWTENSKQH